VDVCADVFCPDATLCVVSGGDDNSIAFAIVSIDDKVSSESSEPLRELSAHASSVKGKRLAALAAYRRRS
jgi:hypothetical protein